MKNKRILVIICMLLVIISAVTPSIEAYIDSPEIVTSEETGYQYMEILYDDGTPTGNILLHRYNGEYSEELVVPEEIDGKTVTATSMYLFYGDSTVKTITLPDTIKKIGLYTFYKCENLETVNIPETVEYVEENFAYYCDNLVNYTLPEDLVKIGKQLNIAYVRIANVTINGAYNYDFANEVIRLINEARVEAGKEPYTTEDEVMYFCINRAPELAIYLGHERPSGLSTQSLIEQQRVPCSEIIGAGQYTPEGVVSQWLNSEFHRPTIMSESATQCGAACYNVDGINYWIFAASSKTNNTYENTYSGTEEKSVEVVVSKYNDRANLTDVEGLEETNTLEVGDTLEPTGVTQTNAQYDMTFNLTMPVELDDVEWTSSNEDVFTVDENGKITAVGAGTATLTVSLLNSSLEYEIIVAGVIPKIELSSPSLENVEVGGTIEYTLSIYGAESVNLTEEDITLEGVTADITIEGTGIEERKIILSNIQGEVGATGYISCIAEGVATNETGNSEELNITTGMFNIIASEEPKPLPTIELSLPSIEKVEVGGTIEYTLSIYNAESVNLTEEDITLEGVTADITIEGTGIEERKIILSNIQGEVGATGYISYIAEGVATNETGNSEELNITTGAFKIIASEEPKPLPTIELSSPSKENVEVGGTIEYTLSIYDAESVVLTKEDITLEGVTADVTIEGTGIEERKIILSNIQGEVGATGYISCIAEGVATNETGNSKELNITTGMFNIIASEDQKPLPTIELSLPSIEKVEVGGIIEYTLSIYDAESVNLTEEDITLEGVTADVTIEEQEDNQRKIILSNIQGEVGAIGYISRIAEGIATNETGDSQELNITTGTFTIIETETTKLYKGDINKDGLVDSADAAIALNLFKYENATEEDLKLGDVDGNGMIDSADAAIILNYFKYNQLIEIE